MGLLSRLRGRKPSQFTPEMKGAFQMGIAQVEAGRPISEEEWRAELGINYEMLHDDVVEKLLEQQIVIPIRRVARNNSGHILKDKDGNPIMEDVLIPNYDIAALRTIVSHMNRTSFVGVKEAELVKLYMEATIISIEMQMDEDTYDLGFGNFLDGLNIYVRLMVNDAIEGRKARLIKTSPRETRVSLQEEQVKRGRLL